MKQQVQKIITKLLDMVHGVLAAAESHVAALGTVKGLALGAVVILGVADLVYIGKLGFLNYMLDMSKNGIELVLKGGWVLVVLVGLYLWKDKPSK